MLHIFNYDLVVFRDRSEKVRTVSSTRVSIFFTPEAYVKNKEPMWAHGHQEPLNSSLLSSPYESGDVADDEFFR